MHFIYISAHDSRSTVSAVVSKSTGVLLSFSFCTAVDFLAFLTFRSFSSTLHFRELVDEKNAGGGTFLPVGGAAKKGGFFGGGILFFFSDKGEGAPRFRI